jgi:hypothetical protein
MRIENMELSKRAERILKEQGFVHIEELGQLDHTQFNAVAGLGVRTLTEIINYILKESNFKNMTITEEEKRKAKLYDEMVGIIVKNENIEVQQKRQPVQPTEREINIVDKYIAGNGISAIADEYCISRERARQILNSAIGKMRSIELQRENEQGETPKRYIMTALNKIEVEK